MGSVGLDRGADLQVGDRDAMHCAFRELESNPLYVPTLLRHIHADNPLPMSHWNRAQSAHVYTTLAQFLDSLFKPLGGRGAITSK